MAGDDAMLKHLHTYREMAGVHGTELAATPAVDGR